MDRLLVTGILIEEARIVGSILADRIAVRLLIRIAAGTRVIAGSATTGHEDAGRIVGRTRTRKKLPWDKGTSNNRRA